jgi:mitotic spindle assembly checkpoint protein MAD1
MMPGGMGASSTEQANKIRQLEALVQLYKTELDAISRDSQDVEIRLTHGVGLVKLSLLEDERARVVQLAADTASLESTIIQLTAANASLDAEVNDLMRRVASGEYNPAAERCLELKANPAAKIHAVRNQELENLKVENLALLDRIKVIEMLQQGRRSVSETCAKHRHTGDCYRAWSEMLSPSAAS